MSTTHTTTNQPNEQQAIPMRIVCPNCGTLHIDEGEFATKLHHTHSCQICGLTWRPAVVYTVGVRFLPGFKNDDEAKKIKLSINQCPVHPSFYSVSIENGTGSGTRITPGKCCGYWREVKSWSLDARELVTIAIEAECAAEQAAKESA